jgi:hypothetical protein
MPLLLLLLLLLLPPLQAGLLCWLLLLLLLLLMPTPAQPGAALVVSTNALFECQNVTALWVSAAGRERGRAG